MPRHSKKSAAKRKKLVLRKVKRRESHIKRLTEQSTKRGKGR